MSPPPPTPLTEWRDHAMNVYDALVEENVEEAERLVREVTTVAEEYEGCWGVWSGAVDMGLWYTNFFVVCGGGGLGGAVADVVTAILRYGFAEEAADLPFSLLLSHAVSLVVTEDMLYDPVRHGHRVRKMYARYQARHRDAAPLFVFTSIRELQEKGLGVTPRTPKKTPVITLMAAVVSELVVLGRYSVLEKGFDGVCGFLPREEAVREDGVAWLTSKCATPVPDSITTAYAAISEEKIMLLLKYLAPHAPTPTALHTYLAATFCATTLPTHKGDSPSNIIETVTALTSSLPPPISPHLVAVVLSLGKTPPATWHKVLSPTSMCLFEGKTEHFDDQGVADYFNARLGEVWELAEMVKKKRRIKV